ncbi:hypothetical protein LCGC14_0543280 [marine sediment metagenome]|uniref:Uncharacterized protein n=1 Tax=marine sediment metagenome TaxID=412755 RepID=A0A0F9SAM6_9ZZZZ|nr:MAG: hypothetical protein Lokiarch_36040 [Candidatus Lokiarchaeum sp. GC14_75]
MYIFARHFYLLWLFDERGLLGYIFFIFIYGGAIVGAILGFMDKNIGHYLCLLTGIIYPLWMLFYFLARPSTFLIGFFESFLDVFYHTIPMLLLFIGGISGMIEWRLGLRKNKLAQEYTFRIACFII